MLRLDLHQRYSMAWYGIAFSSADPRLWNTLPTGIKRAATLTFLKNSRPFFSLNIYADFTVFYHPLLLHIAYISVNSWSSSHVSCIVCLV